MRHSEPEKNIESELYSTEAFTSFSVDELRKELGIPDVLMQDVCEYLELHKHISITQRNGSVIKKIRATKLGFQTYKFETYIGKNETLVYQEYFKKSALETNLSVTRLNNEIIPQQFDTNKRLTKIAIWVAAASAIISLATFIKTLQPKDKELQQTLQKQSQALDSLKQNLHQTNALLNKLKTISYKDTVKTKAKQIDTTR